MKVRVKRYIILLSIIFLSSVFLSTGVVAEQTVVVDERSGEGNVDTLQEAIETIDNGGEIIINEPQDITSPYEGAKIGKLDDILSDGKSMTIRGEGIVLIEPSSSQDSVIKLEENENRDVTFENILFVNSEHAIEAKSGSNVILEDVALDNTITDTPFILNGSIQTSDVGGATIEDNGVYYPESFSTQSEDIVEAISGDLRLETIGTDPTGLIYERNEDALEYNPVITSNINGQITVGSPDDDLEPSDDYNIQTPFYSLQAAVDAASSDSVINVYDRTEEYQTVEFTGVGTSGLNNITINGVEQRNSNLPTVQGFKGDYPGEYTVRNMQIMDEVIVDTDSVNLDLSGNYWLSSDGPSEDMIEITTGTSANIIEEPFCVDDRCQNELSFSDLNKCINIESRNSQGNTLASESYGCDAFSDEVDITISDFISIEESSRIELFDFDYTDFREADIDIETDSDEDIDVDINVISSDNSTDGEFTVDSSESFKSGTIEAQFSTIIDQLDIGESIDLNPQAEITVNNNPSFTIPLDRTRVEGISDDDDLLRLPDNIGQNQGSIQRDDFTGLIQNETTYVSRFHANNDDNAAFQDNVIPPTRDDPRGTVRFFEEIRTGPDRAAIVRPENPLRVGMSTQSISEANTHQLNITYALQADDNPRNYIDVQIVDENSNEIYTSRPNEDSELNVTSTTDEPFDSTGDTENLETKTKEIPLHSSEIDYVNENGELYMIFENMEIDEDAVLLLYNVEVQSSDEIRDIDSEIGDEGGESVSTPDERPGGFTVSFNVDANQNTEYGTYDVEPEEDLSSDIIIENTGDTTIDSEFAVVDEYETPEIRYPNEEEFSSSNIENREEELDRFKLRIEGGETETIPISNSWSESEFGNHTVKVYEIDSDGEYREIDEEEGETPQFDAYVFQKATFEIADINVTEEHLTHDNFNSEIIVRNIGDLSGERTLYAEFEEWEVEKDVSLGGGDARANTTSEETTIRFSREQHPNAGGDFDFTFREYTTEHDVIDYIHDSVQGPFEVDETPLSYEGSTDDSYYRPNAPFGLEEGEHQYRAYIMNEMDGDAFSEVDDALISEKERDITLNKIVINDLNIMTEDGELTQRPTEDEGTIYASAYPYVQPSDGRHSSIVVGETYVEDNSVRGGLSTMYSYNADVRNNEINRGATPLNLQGTDAVTQPDNRYFSIYYNHQNRYCNPDLLGDGQTQVSESEADESDTNVFLPYSADTTMNGDMCSDINRYVSLQLPRFADSTDENVELDRTNIAHPDGEFEISGTNQDEFWDLDEDGSIMYAVATVSNPSDSQPATARFEIRTDREQSDAGDAIGLGEINDNHQAESGGELYDDNVVGIAAVELRPEETQEVKVPIVIRNDDGNAGVHTLSIHPRSEDDYIRRSETVTPPNEMAPSELTGETHSQFEVPINVKTYGDAIIESNEPVDNRQATDSDPQDAQDADLVVNNVCTSNANEAMDNRANWQLVDGSVSPDLEEGLNPLSGIENELGVVRDVGTCNTEEPTDETVAEFETEYTNYGGSTVEIQPEAIAEFESREYMTRTHRESAQITGDRLFADYESNTNVGTNAELNAIYTADGDEIDFTESIEVDPGDSVTFGFSREFQEPGLYHIRHSPCRVITDEGPKHYNLRGFTGIADSIDRAGQVGDRNTWIDNHDRTEFNYNTMTTNVFENAAFHGAKGCDDQVTSVFVYDTTNPVADYRITESASAVKSADDTEVQTELASQVPDGGITADMIYDDESRDFEVYEGGMLLFDGSSKDCPNCYDSDIPTHDTSIADVTDWDGRVQITESELKNHRMSQVNTRITEMLWRVNGEEPNQGNENLCTDVSQDSIDEHCYMESFIGDDDYEVIAHRFNDPGEDTISLQVWDDDEFTEGDRNTNITEHSVNVIENEENPTVDTDYSLHNDLTYDSQTEAQSEETLWHRIESVFDEVDYRDSPDNFESDYSNTYEGTRMCMNVTEKGDNQIGISQDAWWQIIGGSQEYIDEGIIVTDDGNYVERTGETSDSVINPWHLNTNLDETRDGDRRCWIFDEEDSSGDNDREQTFEYQVWDFANNDETSRETVDIITDTTEPSITEASTSFDTATGNNPSGTDNGWVWAHNQDVGFDGGTDFAGDDVQFNIAGEDDNNGIGVACLDLQLDVGSGPSYEGEDIHENCQSMGDMSGETPDYKGTHGNDANSGASADVGSSQTPDRYSSDNYLSTSELGDAYELQIDPVTDFQFDVSEEVYVVDWHGNKDSRTIEFDVQVDGTNPNLSGSYSCSGSSCGTDTVDFNSEGPDGGTYIVDARVTDVSGGLDSCDIDGDNSGSTCDYDGESAEVVDFDYKDFAGEVEVEVDASVTASASVSSASASCDSCGDSDTDRTRVDVDADASGDVTVEIMDAHGNTQERTYDWSISDSDTDRDRDRCNTPPCDDDDGD